MTFKTKKYYSHSCHIGCYKFYGPARYKVDCDLLQNARIQHQKCCTGNHIIMSLWFALVTCPFDRHSNEKTTITCDDLEVKIAACNEHISNLILTVGRRFSEFRCKNLVISKFTHCLTVLHLNLFRINLSHLPPT